MFRATLLTTERLPLMSVLYVSPTEIVAAVSIAHVCVCGVRLQICLFVHACVRVSVSLSVFVITFLFDAL